MGDVLKASVRCINTEVAYQRRAMELRSMPLDRTTREAMQPHLDEVVALIDRLDKHRATIDCFMRREEALNARVLRMRARALHQARRMAAIRDHLPQALADALEEALVVPQTLPEPSATAEQLVEQVPEVAVPDPVPEPEPEPACNLPQLARVTDAELADCPQYVKGRLTVEKIGRVVEKFNQFVCAKYEIADRTLRECRAGPDRERWQAYKDSECEETHGETFVTDLELRAFSDFKMDATARQTINVLRHLGRIKEVRGKKKARCFILK